MLSRSRGSVDEADNEAILKQPPLLNEPVKGPLWLLLPELFKVLFECDKSVGAKKRKSVD
jgi:hypothetical protein